MEPRVIATMCNGLPTCRPSMKLITSSRLVVRPGIELGMSIRFKAPCACRKAHD